MKFDSGFSVIFRVDSCNRTDWAVASSVDKPWGEITLVKSLDSDRVDDKIALTIFSDCRWPSDWDVDKRDIICRWEDAMDLTSSNTVRNVVCSEDRSWTFNFDTLLWFDMTRTVLDWRTDGEDGDWLQSRMPSGGGLRVTEEEAWRGGTLCRNVDVEGDGISDCSEVLIGSKHISWDDGQDSSLGDDSGKGLAVPPDVSALGDTLQSLWL